MEVVKIGRTEVDKDLFITSVANARTLPDICKSLGLNPSVVTTKQNIKNRIYELGLPTKHLVYFDFKPSEELMQKRVKTFKLSKSNADYMNRFLDSLPEQSRSTYKSSCGNFLEGLGTNDFTRVSPKRIMDFANQKKTESMKNNVMAHIRSMMIFCVNSNLNEAKEKVSKEMLIWLISK
jgi:hypothetical protein